MRQRTRLGNVGSVGAVIQSLPFQAIVHLIIELLVSFSFLGQFQPTSRGTCHDCFLDYTHDYVLLQSLARDVQRQLLQFHDARDEVQPLRNERIAVVSQTQGPRTT